MIHPVAQAAHVRSLRHALYEMHSDAIPHNIASILAERFGRARAEQILDAATISLLAGLSRD